MKYKIENTYYDGEHIQDFYVVVDHQNGWSLTPIVKTTKLEDEG